MFIWRVGNQIAKMIHDHLNDVLKNQIWTFLEQFYVTLKTLFMTFNTNTLKTSNLNKKWGSCELKKDWES